MVPIIEKILRIELLQDDSCVHGKRITFQGMSYTFAAEHGSMESNPGVLVSCWMRSEACTNPNVSMDEVRAWVQAYGTGFGS